MSLNIAVDPSANPVTRVALVTGATSGIGRATALQLAALGFELILTGRNRAAGIRLQRQLKRTYPGRQFAYFPADLASLEDVRKLARSIRAQTTVLHLLVNNAGARIDRYDVSPDGFELTFATNHLGHFLLTALLIDRVLAVHGGRIVTLSSRRHRFVRHPRRWLTPPEQFERWEVYSNSKLANTLFAFELARRLNGTTAVSHAVDPGIVASGFSRNNGFVPWLRHIVSSLRSRDLVSPAHAARTVVHAAVDESSSGASGRYYFEGREATPAPVALDAQLAAELWNLSVQCTGLKPEECPGWAIFKPNAAAVPR